MEKQHNQKHENLRKAGLYNCNHQKITEPLFSEHPTFFDPCDNLQVRYEILRSNMVEGASVVDVCKRFGITRQSFYTLQDKLLQKGTAGLLPEKPGPRGPSKLTEDLLTFVNQQIQQDQNVSVISIVNNIQLNYGVSLHQRTIEKLIKNLYRKKKLQKPHYPDE